MPLLPGNVRSEWRSLLHFATRHHPDIPRRLALQTRPAVLRSVTERRP